MTVNIIPLINETDDKILTLKINIKLHQTPNNYSNLNLSVKDLMQFHEQKMRCNIDIVMPLKSYHLLILKILQKRYTFLL